jgi:hypothetical protein
MYQRPNPDLSIFPISSYVNPVFLRYLGAEHLRPAPKEAIILRPLSMLPNIFQVPAESVFADIAQLDSLDAALP